MVYRYRRDEDDRLDEDGRIIQETEIEDREAEEMEAERLQMEEDLRMIAEAKAGRSSGYGADGGRTVSFMGESYDWDGLTDDEKDALG